MSNAKDLPVTVTHHVRDTCLCLHVQRAARALARRFDEAFRPLDLTSGQFTLLMSLNRPAQPTIQQAAEELAMDRTTLTAALKPLARRGLVAVTVDDADRRSRRMALTPAGRAMLVAAMPIWEATQAELECPLADPDRLRADLRALHRENARR